MTTTYVGPEVAPAFVAGIINDAFDQALDRTRAARTTVARIAAAPITGAPLTPLLPAGDASVDLPALPDLPPEDSVNSLADQLRNLLATFIGSHLPAESVPDGAATWERVMAGFNGGSLRAGLDKIRARVDSTWAARGYTPPAAARDSQLRDFDRDAGTISTQSLANKEAVRLSHRKSIEITGYEMNIRAYADALRAARSFLLATVLDLQSKTNEDRLTAAHMKRELQTAFFRQLDAQLGANNNAFERQMQDRRIHLEADQAGLDRRTFVFRQRTQAALDELQSIASQASAAINRVSASAGVSGSERTP